MKDSHGCEESEKKSERDLRKRTKEFALRIIKLVTALPSTRDGNLLGRQLLRSGTSIGANYREASRARSKAEFKSEIGVVEQEADETLYWLELLGESGIVNESRLSALIQECDELIAIFTTIGKRSKD